MTANPYDGRAFTISTPKPGPNGFYDGGWITPIGGSATPMLRIAGWGFGGRYDLDTGSGKMEDWIQGPLVGPEIIEFIAKCGGEVATYTIPAFPGWTLKQYTSPKAVTGGPNTVPYTPDISKPLVPGAPSVPPLLVVAPPTPPAVGSVASTPVAHDPMQVPTPQAVAPVPSANEIHLSLVSRIENLIAQLRRHLGG